MTQERNKVWCQSSLEVVVLRLGSSLRPVVFSFVTIRGVALKRRRENFPSRPGGRRIAHIGAYDECCRRGVEFRAAATNRGSQSKAQCCGFEHRPISGGGAHQQASDDQRCRNVCHDSGWWRRRRRPRLVSSLLRPGMWWKWHDTYPKPIIWDGCMHAWPWWLWRRWCWLSVEIEHFCFVCIYGRCRLI